MGTVDLPLCGCRPGGTGTEQQERKTPTERVLSHRFFLSFWVSRLSFVSGGESRKTRTRCVMPQTRLCWQTGMFTEEMLGQPRWAAVYRRKVCFYGLLEASADRHTDHKPAISALAERTAMTAPQNQ